jgi:predicted Ser/Thr protein kinase
MGVVYRATQLTLDRMVGLKVITPAFAEDDEFRERFKRESRLAASIEHPNVIPVYEAGEHDGVLFLAMRFVEGTDLGSLLKRETRLEPLRATRFVAQIAAALDAAHNAGLVHRDVKPANALVTSDDHVYLTDFGLTKRAASGSAMTKTGQMVGTVDYVAPEQVEGGAVDARTDVYSLGCVLFHLLTGRVPYDKPSEMAKLFAHVNDAPPAPSAYVPGLPPELDEVVARGMAKSPGDRYLSAGDLGRAALAAAEHRSLAEPERSVARGEAAPDIATAATVLPAGGAPAPGAPPAAAGQHPAQPRNLKPWAIGAAALVLGGIVLALVTGGGTGASDTSTSSSSSKLPAGGQSTVVNSAPPPTPGDKVIRAAETTVHGVYYRLVLSTRARAGAQKGIVPLYMNEYIGSAKSPRILQRLKMPYPFAHDSYVADFKVEANPDPNPDKTAGVALSWFLHTGDKNDQTHYFGLTRHGIDVY